ncbi:TPA: glucosaminidase domain-containing protein [Streptococcus suis]
MILAQAILESAWGNSTLTQQANNLFGIKADSNRLGGHLP